MRYALITNLLALTTLPVTIVSASCSEESEPADSGTLSCDLSGVGMGDCPECVEEKCSDLMPYCETDPECACLVECLAQRGVGKIPACLADLGLAQRPPAFIQIEECVAFACPDSDECSTPADWVPPDADLVCDGRGTGGLGGGTEPDCAFDTTLAYDPLGSVLQLQNVDQQLCVRLERRDDGPGALQNTSWSLIDVRIGRLGEVAHVSASGDRCWYSSHHNFRDWAHIWTGTRRYDLVLKEDGHGGTETGHDGNRRYHLYVFEGGPVDAAKCAPTADGVGCVSGPIVLTPYEPK